MQSSVVVALSCFFVKVTLACELFWFFEASSAGLTSAVVTNCSKQVMNLPNDNDRLHNIVNINEVEHMDTGSNSNTKEFSLDLT